MHINKIKPSAEIAISKRAIIDPIKCEPTSPKIILAGFVFHQRNPKHDPATDEIKMDVSNDIKLSSIKFE